MCSLKWVGVRIHFQYVYLTWQESWIVESYMSPYEKLACSLVFFLSVSACYYAHMEPKDVLTTEYMMDNAYLMFTKLSLVLW